jgi:hypothetical protein
VIKNVNYFTKYADQDLCGDETSWAHGGYGEADYGLVGRVMGKPGMTRGGQTVIISDVSCTRPRAYIHRHKKHTMPPGWTKQVHFEAKSMIDELLLKVEDDSDDEDESKIFKSPPHITFDNYFCDDVVLDYMGQRGFGATMMNRRDCLPQGIPGMYICKEKTEAKTQRSSVAIFNNPITLVKEVAADGDMKAYRRVRSNFQSTSSCNIATVNALNDNCLYVKQKDRGQGPAKRIWGIEMSSSREMYLKTYGRIDVMDHLIKNCSMHYCSWKYWHSAMLHAKAMAIVTAYDMYIECAAGKLNPLWKVQKPMTLWRFRERLSIQILQYDPQHHLYPGDEALRKSTQKSKAQRKTSKVRASALSDSGGIKRGRGRPNKRTASPTVPNGVTAEFLSTAITGRNARLCGNLSNFMRHINSRIYDKHGCQCVYCGLDWNLKCGICKEWVHWYPKTGVAKGADCYMKYNDEEYFGLGYDDQVALLKKRRKDWTAPNLTQRRANARHVA